MRSEFGHTFLPSRNRCPSNANCHHSKKILSFCFLTKATEKSAKEGKPEQKKVHVHTVQDGLFYKAESSFRRGALWGCAEGQLSRSSAVGGTAPPQCTPSHGHSRRSTLPAPCLLPASPPRSPCCHTYPPSPPLEGNVSCKDMWNLLLLLLLLLFGVFLKWITFNEKIPETQSTLFSF